MARLVFPDHDPKPATGVVNSRLTEKAVATLPCRIGGWSNQIKRTRNICHTVRLQDFNIIRPVEEHSVEPDPKHVVDIAKHNFQLGKKALHDNADRPVTTAKVSSLPVGIFRLGNASIGNRLPKSNRCRENTPVGFKVKVRPRQKQSFH